MPLLRGEIAVQPSGLFKNKIQITLNYKNKSLKMAEEKFLVPRDVYLKSGIHIGTKFRTKYMEQFIYKTRPDGLSVLNLQKIDERIRQAANLLSQFVPEDILIVSRRENGWKAVRAFGKHTTIRVFAGRY